VGVGECACAASWIAIPLAVVLLDLTIYFQHVMFHASHALALHRVHHTDLDFDVTTGTRFHPIEILISTGSSVRRSPRSVRRPAQCWRSSCC